MMTDTPTWRVAHSLQVLVAEHREVELGKPALDLAA
jgi:hypothetical protein